MTTIPTQMFGIQMGSQGSTQYGNFEDGNMKVLRKVLYLAVLDSHQFLQWQVMNFWVRNLGKPFASVFSWQQSQKATCLQKWYSLSSYSFSPQDLLKASSKSFFISILLKGSKSLFKNGNKNRKNNADIFGKKGEIRMKRFPSHPREKVFDLQFIENFLEKT